MAHSHPRCWDVQWKSLRRIKTEAASDRWFSFSFFSVLAAIGKEVHKGGLLLLYFLCCAYAFGAATLEVRFFFCYLSTSGVAEAKRRRPCFSNNMPSFFFFFICMLDSHCGGLGAARFTELFGLLSPSLSLLFFFTFNLCLITLQKQTSQLQPNWPCPHWLTPQR